MDRTDAQATAQAAGSQPAEEQVLTIAQAEEMLSEPPAGTTDEAEGAADQDAATPETPPKTDPEQADETEADGTSVEDDAKEPDAHAEKPKGSRSEERIHELIDKLKAKDAELAGVNEKVKQWDDSVVKNLALPIDYVTPAEAQAIQTANAAQAERQFLMRNIGTGFEHPSDPSRNLTISQIGERLAQLEPEMETHAATRTMYRERMRQFVEDAKAGREARNKKPATAATAKTAGTKPTPKPAVKTTAPASAKAAPSAAKKPAGVTHTQFDAWVKQYGPKEAAAMAAASAY